MTAALVELRRYTLHPGRRDELIALFQRELVTTQEDVGLQVLAQYRDADQPDQFVWLRGFATSDAQQRADALTRFYGGPVWAQHADAANATMIDSDDVLLLRPLAPFRATGDTVATTCLLSRALTPAEEQELLAALPTASAVLVTADVENLFPRLPVRDVRAAVWLGAGHVPSSLESLLVEPPQVATLIAA